MTSLHPLKLSGVWERAEEGGRVGYEQANQRKRKNVPGTAYRLQGVTCRGEPIPTALHTLSEMANNISLRLCHMFSASSHINTQASSMQRSPETALRRQS